MLKITVVSAQGIPALDRTGTPANLQQIVLGESEGGKRRGRGSGKGMSGKSFHC